MTTHPHPVSSWLLPVVQILFMSECSQYCSVCGSQGPDGLATKILPHLLEFVSQHAWDSLHEVGGGHVGENGFRKVE